MREISSSLKLTIGRFSLLLGQVMDPQPRMKHKIYGIAGVKATRDTPINEACADVVASKLSNSGNFMGQLMSLLMDFWSRRAQLGLAIRENIRFSGKLAARRNFAHETLRRSNNALPENQRLTTAKMRILALQMEAFAWPFDGAWQETPQKEGDDPIEKVKVTFPAEKRTAFLDALTVNLNALKTALKLPDALPTDIAKLAVTYLAQVDPRAALAIKSLNEFEYNTFLVGLEERPNAALLKAAVAALRTAPDDAALLQAKPELAATFQNVDKLADKFEPSIGGALKMLREM